MNSALESQLKNIGLADKESKVYLASLELGPATAQQISQKAGVNRATTYVQIESLTEKGLMSSFEKGKKTFFSSESPEFLAKLVEKEKNTALEKENTLSNIFPELKNLFEYAGERPKVRFFEGKEGIKTMQEELLKSKTKTLDEFVPLDEAYNVFPPGAQDHRHKVYRALGNVKIRTIYTSKKGNIVPVGKGQENHKIPSEKFPFTTEVSLDSDKVAIISYKGKLIGVIIESKEIAESFRFIFDLAWEAAKNYQK